MKIGRNDPCPCGSGKKYKKCCLSKDDEERSRRIIEEREPFQAEAGEAAEVGATALVGERGFVGDTKNPENVAEGEDSESGDDSALAVEDQKVVDDWWHAMMPLYKKNDAEEMARRMMDFHEAHPDLFEHLMLHEEFLYELGAELGRRDQHSRYAELLMRLRREQPGMYRRRFGYYDHAIIADLIVQNRRAEIQEYFGYFEEYPDKYPDYVDQAIELLAWKGWDAELFALVSATALPMMTSRDVIDGSFVAEWLVLRAYKPYLVAPELASDAADRIFRDFQSWDEAFRPTITRDKIDEYLRLARQAPSAEVFKKGYGRKREDYTRLHGAFLRFLQNDRGLPWTTARFLADRLSSFWLEYRRNALPGDVLYPKDADIEKCLVKTCVRFISLDGVKFLSALQALAFFGLFLESKGIFDPTRIKSWDDGIAGLYAKGRRCMEPTDCAYRIYPSYESLRWEEGFLLS